VERKLILGSSGVQIKLSISQSEDDIFMIKEPSILAMVVDKKVPYVMVIVDSTDIDYRGLHRSGINSMDVCRKSVVRHLRKMDLTKIMASDLKFRPIGKRNDGWKDYPSLAFTARISSRDLVKIKLYVSIDENLRVEM